MASGTEGPRAVDARGCVRSARVADRRARRFRPRSACSVSSSAHTELIKRGKRQKPVEFGHKVLLCESIEKFITDYEVYEKQQSDCDLTKR